MTIMLEDKARFTSLSGGPFSQLAFQIEMRVSSPLKREKTFLKKISPKRDVDLKPVSLERNMGCKPQPNCGSNNLP